METVSLNGEVEDRNLGANSKKKTTRSASYPIKSLADCLAFVEPIYHDLGYHEFHDKNDIANIHHTSYDAIKQVLSTCQQYGLLEIKHGAGYKPTELFVEIHLPGDETEQRQAIIRSIASPESFKFLIDKFGNHPIPAIIGIQNTLIKDYGYKRDIAAKTANLFLDNLKNYSLLNKNGAIDFKSEKALDKQNDRASEDQNEKPLQVVTKPTIDEKPLNTVLPHLNAGILDILIPMKSTNEKAHLYIPENYKDEDLDRILKFVEALK